MLSIAICDDDIRMTGNMERMVQRIAKRNFVKTDEYSAVAEPPNLLE